MGVQREELAQGLGVSHGVSGNPQRLLGDLTLRVGRTGSWENWPSGFLLPRSSDLSTGPAATRAALRESSEKGRGSGRCQRAEVSELGGLAWGPRGLWAPGRTPSWEADSRKGRAARLLSFRGARDILLALGHPAGAARSGDWPSWGRGNSAMAPAIRERQQLWTLSSQRK